MMTMSCKLLLPFAFVCLVVYLFIYVFIYLLFYVYSYIQGVTGGMDQTSGGCSLC